MTAYKLMLLGEIGVGKSSLARRLVFDKFEFDYKPTIGVDVYRYQTPETETSPAVSLIVWDTDGNFGNAIFRHIYMKEAHAALVVADLTRPQTLVTMKQLADGFADMFPGRHVGYVLNKADMTADIDMDAINSLWNSHERAGIKTSARTGDGVIAAFSAAAAAVTRRMT